MPGFARERLGVWEESVLQSAFDLDAVHAACLNPSAAPGVGVVFGVDASPEGASAAIVSADGTAVELVAHRHGMGWLFRRGRPALPRRTARQWWWTRQARWVRWCPKWQAIPGVDVVTMTTRDLTNACGGFAQSLIDGAVADPPA